MRVKNYNPIEPYRSTLGGLMASDKRPPWGKTHHKDYTVIWLSIKNYKTPPKNITKWKRKRGDTQ